MLHGHFITPRYPYNCCLCIVIPHEPAMNLYHYESSRFFLRTATLISSPNPRHPVFAPSCCDNCFGNLVRTFAMNIGSVSGVRSSRLGNCWMRVVRQKAGIGTTLYPFNAIIRSFPAAYLPDDQGRFRSERVVYSRVMSSKEDMINSKSESRENEYTCRHDALRSNITRGRQRKTGRTYYSDDQIGRAIVM